MSVDQRTVNNKITLGDMIHQSPTTSVFRGFYGAERAIFKVCRTEHASSALIDRLRHEREISVKISGPHSPVVLDWIRLEDYVGIAYADMGAVPLSEYARRSAATETDIVAIGIQIAAALAHVHRHSIIHKDICPDNVVINPETKQIQVIDFGIASLVPKEIYNVDSGDLLQGTLQFMSPEQTGRINRPIDARTDLFSLGTTLYFLATGSSPFVGGDANEIVHKILAMNPESVKRVNPAFSQNFADIVALLLEKDPEKRYQSANGVCHDLKMVASALAQNQTARIELKSRDYLERLRIPDKVYDRDDEVRRLTSAYTQAKGGEKITCLVHGPSGIGKSALIGELRAEVYQEGNLFFSGKFDQYKKNIPYVAFSQIFDQIFQYILKQSAARVRDIRALLDQRFGEDLGVFEKINPDFCVLVPEARANPQLPAQIVRNRIFEIAEYLLLLAAEDAKTCIVVIDDVQWIDSESLALLKYLTQSPNVPRALFICAYRDNEVDASHPFIRYGDRLREDGHKVTEVAIKELSRSGVVTLLQETFLRQDEVIEKLASVVEARTACNPFFVRTFVEDLTRHGVVKFSWETHCWDVDLVAVETLPHSANVVDFLLKKFETLSEATRFALMTASCIGQIFDLRTLCLATERSTQEIIGDLSVAIGAGLVIPLSTEYGYLWSGTAIDDAGLDLEKVVLRFGHDKIQQSSHEMMPHDQRARLHVRLGFALRDSLAPARRHEMIFDIADHLNYADESFWDVGRLDEIIEVNVAAGELAQRAGSHGSSLFYFQRAYALLNALPASRFVAQIHCGLARSYHSAGTYQPAMAVISSLITKIKNQEDIAQALEIKASIFEAMGQYQQAVDTCISGIRLLGIRTPKTVNKFKLGLIIARARLSFHDRFFTWLEEDGTMTGRRWDIIMSLANRAIPSAYLCDPDMQICLTITVTLAAHKENVRLDNPAFLVTVACILNILRMAGRAASLRKVAYIKREKNRYHPLDTVFQLVDGHWGAVHTGDYKSIVEIEQGAFDKALEEGDPGNASSAIFLMHLNAMGGGHRLPEVLTLAEKFKPFFEKHKDTHAYFLFYSVLQLAKAFAGRTAVPDSLTDDEVSETEIIQACDISDGHKAIYGVVRAWLDFHNRNDRAAMGRAIRNPVQLILPGCFSGAINLVVLAMAYYRSPKEAPLILRIPLVGRFLLACIRWELKWWHSQYRNVMAGHYLLLKAEWYAAAGRYKEAWQKYQDCIQVFRNSEQHYWAALAHENYGRSLVGAGLRLGINQLQQAARVYEEYGSALSVSRLHAEFPGMLGVRDGGPHARSRISKKTTETRSSNELDIASMLKSATAISDQLDLGQLIASLLRFTIENGGATYGALVLIDGDAATVEAVGDLRSGAFEYRRLADDLETVEKSVVATTMVSYVRQSNGNLIINSFAEHSEWQHDQRIKTAQPKSVICLPVSNAGRTYAILYLENNLLDNAFTQSRVETLKILTAQGAIAIKNARYIVDIHLGSKKITQLNARLEKVLGSTQSMASSRQAQNVVTIALSTVKDEVAALSDVSCHGYLREADGSFSKYDFETSEKTGSGYDQAALLKSLGSSEHDLTFEIKWQTETIGFLVFACGRPMVLSEEDRVFIDTVFQSLALSLTNIEYQVDLEAKVTFRTKELNEALQIVSEKRQKIQAILDHIDQAILTVDSSLRIEQEYSAFLEVLLAKPSDEIAGSTLNDAVLRMLDIAGDQTAQINEIIQIIIGEDELNWDLNRDNLPREAQASVGSVKKLLSIDWKPILDDAGITQKLMMTMRDITEQRRLQEQLSRHEEEQQQRMGRIAKMIAAGPAKALQYLQEAQEQLKRWREAATPAADPAQFRRVIHTVKGSCRTLGFMDIAETCHLIESEQVHASDSPHLVQLEHVVADYINLGLSVFSIGKDAAPEHWNLMSVVSDMLSRIVQPLRSEGIPIGEVSVTDGVGVWPETLSRQFSGMMMHCLNNAVDHGYLLPRQKGKRVGPFALAIKSKVAGDRITVTIEDKGAGLDLEKLTQLAKSRDIADPLEVPFADDVSTADVVSLTSGRGIGLSAVRKWARDHGGDARLYPATSQGTVCEIHFNTQAGEVGPAKAS